MKSAGRSPADDRDSTFAAALSFTLLSSAFSRAQISPVLFFCFQVLAGFFGPGLRLLRGIHAGWPKNRAETGPDPPDYALVIRPYADALMLKASFHRQFPEFENNYSVAAGAFEPQTLSALKALQAVQDGLLGCLRMAFNNSGGLRPRDVPKSLRVAILLVRRDSGRDELSLWLCPYLCSRSCSLSEGPESRR